MQASKQTVSPLRQRMEEDLRMRKLAPKTRQTYIRAVRKFAKFLGRSPDTATDEDLRRFQLHLIDQGTSPITLNATIVGLNFLFEVTLGRPEAMAKMQSVRVPFQKARVDCAGTTKTLGGECLPLATCAQHKHDAFKYQPGIFGFASAAGLSCVGLICNALTRWDQWLNTIPKFIGDFPCFCLRHHYSTREDCAWKVIIIYLRISS